MATIQQLKDALAGKDARITRLLDDLNSMQATLNNMDEVNRALRDRVHALQQPKNPLDIQIGGDSYKHLQIQPIEYIQANQLSYEEGNVVKYITRWKNKNVVQDLEKAKHYIELLIAAQPIQTAEESTPAQATEYSGGGDSESARYPGLTKQAI